MNRIRLNKHKGIRILYHCLFWLGILVLLPIFVSKGSGDYFRQVGLFAITLPFDMIVVYVSFYILIPNFLIQKKIFAFILLFIITGLLFILLQRTFIYYVLYPEEANSQFFARDLPGFILITFIIYGIALTVKLLKLWFKKNQELNEMNRNKLHIELKLKEAELSLLKAQLHPHFLFNTLNNLYGLTLEKSDQAPAIVLRISDMLNYMLHESNQTTVPMAKEIKYLRDYLDLEKLRFGEELKLDFKEEGNYADFEIAPLILIPFVENAFKHGARVQTEGAEISVQIKADSELFILRVENSVELDPRQKDNEKSGGLGLANVKKRLELLYKGRYILDIDNKTDTFVIRLEIRKHGA
ncbi:MAG: histidine kinase [Bacteroidetes bacterium]|nr:histidine kinase [Bacteroidota bacterium]MBT7465495.1 histidine kinase [Bacteroidota bacterium]